MTTSVIRQKLYDYIRDAEDRKVKAIYTMLEAELEGEDYDRWNDEAFVAEMVKRSEDLQSGKVKGVSWEEVKKKALNPSRVRRK